MTTTASDHRPNAVASAPPQARRRGALPRPLSRFVRTPLFDELSPRLVHNQRRGTIMAVSGSVGLGKTEATAQAIRDLGQRAAWIQMSTGLSARGHMAEIWSGVTGTRTDADLLDIRDDLINHLLTDEIQVLAMDDAHFIPPAGMRVLVSVWNEVHLARGRGMPMVLVGNGLLGHVAKVPEIRSRIGPKVEANPLVDDELRAVLVDLEPRLDDFDPKALRDIDRRYCKGELRQWSEFIETVRSITPTEAPITAREAGIALTLLGFITPTPTTP